MTVKEMIEILGTFPEESRVVVNGYEGGLADIEPLSINRRGIVLFYNPRSEWWLGPHEAHISDIMEKEPDEEAVIISRKIAYP